MKTTILFYGLLAFSLLMLFQLSKMQLFYNPAQTELMVALVAVVSLALGLFFGRKGNTSAHNSNIDRNKLESIGISSREYEVLMLIKEGLSNREIAEKLYVSENTIKSHVSNLLVKLDARRRTQAVSRANELKII